VTEPLRFLLKKADRILKRSEFLGLSETGRRLSAYFFIALVAPAKGERSRIGITVSRKVGGAVERNRIKRLAREAFRLNRHLFSRPLDICLIARRAAAEQPNRAIAVALKDLYDNLPRKIEN
jgi:ribonuclease P protein component